jgi:asparagine synthase (glutamine-hydrolysing)
MSGGVDSSAVAAAASTRRWPGDRVSGYSAVFPDHPDVDESPRVTALASALALDVIQLRLQPTGHLRVALEFMHVWGTPPPGGFIVEHETLTAAAAAGATVALDGQGGDETFGHWPFVPADLLRRGRVVASWRSIRRFPGATGQPARKVARFWKDVALRPALPHAAHRVGRLRGRHADPPPWLRTDAARRYESGSDAWAWKLRKGPRSWTWVLNLLTGPGRNGFAEYQRRRAGLFGIEGRPPLLDVDLAEFVLSIPPELTLDPFTDRPLIREAMLNVVPDSVRLHRTKSNLSPYYLQGLLTDLDAVRRLLGPDARIYRYVERDAVDELLAKPPVVGDRHGARWMTDVSNLAGAESWLRREEDRSAIDDMLENWSLSEPRSDLATQ